MLKYYCHIKVSSDNGSSCGSGDGSGVDIENGQGVIMTKRFIF